ncbi:MAG TPA: polysaccharide pyruvyl transferase family protein [Gemmatimonadota bacterium]|nr:polysaccharide pyruvyl transferase family protein [Gemmatimonadota bacterium]
MEQAVVVCNAFPDDNKGGCAITQQTIEWLKGVFPGSPVFIVPVEQTGDHEISRFRFTLRRHPETRILRSPIHTDGSFLTTSFMLLRSFRLLWGRPGNSAFERTMSTAGVVVSKGGYVFVERDTLGGLLGLWFTAFPLIYATRRKVPTVALCTTVGPYRRAASRILCRWILKEVDVVVTRDPISTEEAKRLGCGSVIEAPDIAWTFDERRVRVDVRPPASSGERYGVLVLSDETAALDDIFVRRVGELSDRLLNEKVVDRLVVVLQSHEDRAITTRFVTQRADPRLTLIAADLAPEELMGIYGGAEFLIGRRLHAGVFALLVGVPVLLFSTDGVKADGVMQELGLADRVVRYPDFSVEEVHRRLVAMVGNREAERTAIRDAVRRARVRAAAGLSAVAGLLQVGKPVAEKAAELSV